MTNADHEIIFENLREKREETKEKKESFSSFSSFVLGLLLGAVIAAPLNLLLRPIAYQEGNLVYGPIILLESAPWWVIPLVSIAFLFLLTILLFLTYIIWVDLLGLENVTLPYDTANNSGDFMHDLAEYVTEEGSSLEMNVKYEMSVDQSLTQRLLSSDSEPEKGHVIRCLDPRRELAHKFVLLPTSTSPFSGVLSNSLLNRFYPKRVLEVYLQPKSNEIQITFDPHNEKGVRLLNKMEEEFDRE
jgi:hypothetical protein